MMGGDIVLDENYDSGIEGCPGARFSIFLNRPPLTIDSTLSNDSTIREEEEHHEVIVTSSDSEDDSVKDTTLPETCSASIAAWVAASAIRGTAIGASLGFRMARP